MRVWQIDPAATAVQQQNDAVARPIGLKQSAETGGKPLLCTAWQGDGSALYFAGCAGKALKWDLNAGGGAGAPSQVAQHAAPISHMAWIPGHNVLCTAGWDNVLQYWDCRQPNPVHRFDLGAPCVALGHRDAQARGGGHLLVAAAADRPDVADGATGAARQPAKRPVFVFDLRNPTAPPISKGSPLSHLTRCIEVFADGKGYLLGSIEGRVAVEYEPEQYVAGNQGQVKRSFTFKCHRIDRKPAAGAAQPTGSSRPQDVYPVNAMAVHPGTGTFATTGADGRVCFWDKENKSSLNKLGDVSTGALVPVTAVSYSGDGALLAFASGYDWHAGPPAAGEMQTKYPTRVMVRQTQEKDAQPKVAPR